MFLLKRLQCLIIKKRRDCIEWEEAPTNSQLLSRVLPAEYLHPVVCLVPSTKKRGSSEQKKKKFVTLQTHRAVGCTRTEWLTIPASILLSLSHSRLTLWWLAPWILLITGCVKSERINKEAELPSEAASSPSETVCPEGEACAEITLARAATPLYERPGATRSGLQGSWPWMI